MDFISSNSYSLGVEIEFQILDKEDLKEIANGCPVTRRLEKRYTDVFVI